MAIVAETRHHVPVQVSGHASSRRLSEIQTDIEPLGVHQTFQHLHEPRDLLDHLLVFFARQTIEPCQMSLGCDQENPAISL